MASTIGQHFGGGCFLRSFIKRELGKFAGLDKLAKHQIDSQPKEASFGNQFDNKLFYMANENSSNPRIPMF